MVKKYLAYHQYTLMKNLYPNLRQSVGSLIHILEIGARPLPIVASFQQHLQLIGESVLTSIDFFVEQVSNIIKKLDPNKAHDKTSLGRLKLCGASINKPLGRSLLIHCSSSD